MTFKAQTVCVPLQGSVPSGTRHLHSWCRVSPPSPSCQLHSQSRELLSELQLFYDALSLSSSPTSSSESSSSWASDLASSSTGERGCRAAAGGGGPDPPSGGKAPRLQTQPAIPPHAGSGNMDTIPPHGSKGRAESWHRPPCRARECKQALNPPADQQSLHPRSEAALLRAPAATKATVGPRSIPSAAPSPSARPGPAALTGDVLPAEVDWSSSTLEHKGDGRDQLQTFETDLQRVGAQRPPTPARGEIVTPRPGAACCVFGCPYHGEHRGPQRRDGHWLVVSVGVFRINSHHVQLVPGLSPQADLQSQAETPWQSAQPSASPAARAQARSDGLFGKPRISPFSAGPGAPRIHHPPSPCSSECPCSAGSLQGRSTVCARVSCPPRASLGQAKSKGEAFPGAHSVGKEESRPVHTHPGCPESTATVPPLTPATRSH